MRTEGVTCVWSLAAWPCAMADSDKAMPLRACRMRSPPHVDVARTRGSLRRACGGCTVLSSSCLFVFVYPHTFTVVISATLFTELHKGTSSQRSRLQKLRSSPKRGAAAGQPNLRTGIQRKNRPRCACGRAPHLPQNHQPNITSRGTSVRLRSDLDVSRRQRR